MQRMTRAAAGWITLGLAAMAPAQVWAQGPPATPVYADAARSERVLQRRMVTGELRAVKRSEVAVEEAGIVAELNVREGERVVKGDLILRIDSTRLELALDEVTSELAEARARLEEAKVEAAYWARESEVLIEANRRGASTDKEQREARYEANLSAARRDSADRAIERIEDREALLKLRLRDAEVRAPFDGVIVSRATEVGAWVEEGMSVVVLLGTTQHEAWLDVPQGLLPAVSVLTRSSPVQTEDVESTIPVRVDATGGTYSAGSLRIVPQASRATRQFVLVGVVDAPQSSLIAGGSVTAFVPTGMVGESLTLSKDAVLRGASGPYAMVVREGPGGSFIAMPSSVTVLFETEDRVAVAPGAIAAGDLIVTEGAERLFPGAAIEVLQKPEAGSAPRSATGQREDD